MDRVTSPTHAGDRKREEQWLAFSLRQAARTAPHPCPASLLHGGAPEGYRLTLSFLEAWPLFQAEDRDFGIRLGVTLFDEAAGCFFGPTAHIGVAEYEMKLSRGRRGFHIHLGCSLFFHTRAALDRQRAEAAAGAAAGTSSGGAGLVAIVEVVLVDRNAAGVGCAEYSAGWCAVPLEVPSQPTTTVRTRSNGAAYGIAAAAAAAAPAAAAAAAVTRNGSPARGSRQAAGGGAFCCLYPGRRGGGESDVPLAASGTAPLRQGIMSAQLGAGGELCVPVFVGSPRYLLLHQLLPAHLRLPLELLLADGAACRLHYRFEPCPEAATWAPLVPENYLLSSREVVPGLQRYRPMDHSTAPPDGTAAATWVPTNRMLGVHTQLAPPRLHVVHAVVLTKLNVHLPNGFLDLVRRQAASLWRQAATHSTAAALPANNPGSQCSPPLVSLEDARRSLLLRVSVHNGRRFVGPSVVCRVAALETAGEHRGRHRLVLDRDAPLAWLPADRHVALVLELVLQQQQQQQPRRQAAPSGTGSSQEAPSSSSGGGGGGTVLGWAAVMPFRCEGDAAGSEEGAGSWERLRVAEGGKEVVLRSGPGRWLRDQPVLDWRRLLERTNRSSPAAPTVSCTLCTAPGQAVWPPPPAAALQPQHKQPGATLAKRAAAAAAAAEHEDEDWVVRQQQQQQQAGSPALSEAATLESLLEANISAVEQQQHVMQGDAGALGGEPGAAARGDTGTAADWKMPSVSKCRAAGAGDAQGGLALCVVSTTTTSKRSQQPAWEEETEALFSGSPTAKLNCQQGWAASAASRNGGSGSCAVQAAVEAAAAAVWAGPSSRVRTATGDELWHQIRAEAEDRLASVAATLQLLAFEAAPAASAAAAGSTAAGVHPQPAVQEQPPRELYFTFRFYSEQQPTVTAPLRLTPVPEDGHAHSRTRLHALLPSEYTGDCNDYSGSKQEAGGEGDGRRNCGKSAEAGPAPPRPLTLQLLDAAALQQQVQELREQGAPHSAAVSLVRQQRLRAARYVAEKRLQVDVWDSESKPPPPASSPRCLRSLLHSRELEREGGVGTLSVPLYSLLRGGQPATDALLRVPVLDPAQTAARLDAAPASDGYSSSHSTSSTQCSAQLRGSFVLRLACRGQLLELAAGAGGGSTCADRPAGWPSSPLKRAGQHVVLRAEAALDERGGAAAAELARAHGLEPAALGDRLRSEVVGKATCRVQRQLHFQALSGGQPSLETDSPAAGLQAAGGAGAAACQAGGASGRQKQCSSELLDREVLREVAAARQACKRDIIKRQLQAQLPCCVVLCGAPGDVLAFEREFQNSSGQEAVFEVAIQSDGGSSGGKDGCQDGAVLELVRSEAEWQALCAAASSAAAAAPAANGTGRSGRPICAASFRLRPHESGLLRFKLTRSLGQSWQQQSQRHTSLAWHAVTIRRGPAAPTQGQNELQALGSPASPAARPGDLAASLRVAVTMLPAPVVDRTVRLYCPAVSSGTCTHTIQLASLPAADALLAAASSLTCVASERGISATVTVQPGLSKGYCLQLRWAVPPLRAARRFLLALHTAHGGASCQGSAPLEVWEVFWHGLPSVHLVASVGGSAIGCFPLPPSSKGGSAPHGQQPTWRWQACGAGELQVKGSGGQRVLRFEPAVVGRRQVLLPVAGQDFLLVQLDSSGTEVSRTFEVQLAAGQAVSKKLRYCSPYRHPRRFSVRSTAPALLRVAQACVAFELEGGACTSIKMSLQAAAASVAAAHHDAADGGQGVLQGAALRRGERQAPQEALVVVESFPIAATAAGGAGSSASNGRVEEVFRVLLRVA